MEFKHEFPELQDLQVTSKLQLLRRQQLIALARAYGVEIPGGSKDMILPILIAAEQSGAFRRPVKSRYWRLRAEMGSDSQKKWSDQQMAVFQQALDEAFEHEPKFVVTPPKLANAEYGTFSWMQRELKARGLKTFGMKAAQMRKVLIEQGAMSDDRTEPDQGPSGHEAAPSQAEQVVSAAAGG